MSMSRYRHSAVDVDHLDKDPVGVVIRVKNLSNYNGNNNNLLVQVRNDTNVNHDKRNSTTENHVNRTRPIDVRNQSWNNDFYYNNSQMVDDNITFILRSQNQTEIARTTIKNLSQRQAHNDTKITIPKSIDLLEQNHKVATLNVDVSFYERQDLIGGVMIPSLSLRPPADFKHQYNVIQSYVPKFSNKKGQKANCFSFCDGFFEGQRIQGFDHIQVLPYKFKQRNVPVAKKV